MPVEMSEETHKFWTEVEEWLPRLLREGAVVAECSEDPDELDICTVWWNRRREHVATLSLPVSGWSDDGPVFRLIVDTPGTDGRTMTGVSPRDVVDVIERVAAAQVRAHLPHDWGAGAPFIWDGAALVSFEDDVEPRPLHLGEFVAYVLRELDAALARRTVLDVLEGLMIEGSTDLVWSFPYRGDISTPVGRILIRAVGGVATVALRGARDEQLVGPVRVTPGSHGIMYSFVAMNDLLRAAGGRA